MQKSPAFTNLFKSKEKNNDLPVLTKKKNETMKGSFIFSLQSLVKRHVLSSWLSCRI
jgi:hypothetical protein